MASVRSPFPLLFRLDFSCPNHEQATTIPLHWNYYIGIWYFPFTFEFPLCVLLIPSPVIRESLPRNMENSRLEIRYSGSVNLDPEKEWRISLFHSGRIRKIPAENPREKERELESKSVISPSNLIIISPILISHHLLLLLLCYSVPRIPRIRISRSLQ